MSNSSKINIFSNIPILKTLSRFRIYKFPDEIFQHHNSMEKKNDNNRFFHEKFTLNEENSEKIRNVQHPYTNTMNIIRLLKRGLRRKE